VQSASQLLAEAPARGAWRPATTRLAKLSAIRVLAAVGTPEATRRLRDLRSRMDLDRSLVAHTQRLVAGPILPGPALDSLVSQVLTAASKEDRAAAIAELAGSASIEAIPVIRAALRDRTFQVRKAAAYALAALGDTESLDRFVAWMDGDDHELAKVGAQAIGLLGDLRGAGAILGALARGFSPTTVRESLELLGPWVLGPLLDLVETTPDLAKRASVSSLVKTFPGESTAATLQAWMHGAAGDSAQLARRAVFALDVASARADVIELLSGWVSAQLATVGHADARALKKKLAALEKKRIAKAT
jgi:HEAT repeat protein